MIKPLGGRVLVVRDTAQEKTTGGIYLPEATKEKPQEAKVVALGTGEIDAQGNVLPFNVKVDDKVLISKYGGVEVTKEGVTYTILFEKDILAII